MARFLWNPPILETLPAFRMWHARLNSIRFRLGWIPCKCLFRNLQGSSKWFREKANRQSLMWMWPSTVAAWQQRQARVVGRWTTRNWKHFTGATRFSPEWRLSIRAKTCNWRWARTRPGWINWIWTPICWTTKARKTFFSNGRATVFWSWKKALFRCHHSNIRSKFRQYKWILRLKSSTSKKAS